MVLAWASGHYSDFEAMEGMEEFLDWFEQRLIEDVSVNSFVLTTLVTSVVHVLDHWLSK